MSEREWMWRRVCEAGEWRWIGLREGSERALEAE